MNIHNFGTIKVPILGLPLGSPRKKMSFGCSLVKNHKIYYKDKSVATLALGSRPKQGLTKLRAKCEVRESHIMLPRVWESVREWIPTLPSELPLWELESQWTLESSKSNCRGQNPLNWSVSYIIGKVLKFRCLKWSCMTHFDTLKTSYGQNKGRESNCQIWLPTTKSWKSPRFICMQVACDILLEFFWPWGYNFDSNLISIGGLHKKLWQIMAPQSCESPNFGNFETPIWESWEKMTFGCWSHAQAHNIL
jgi:hypothetical protein